MRSQPHKRAPAHRDRRSLTDYQLPRRRVGEREQRGSRPTWETRPSRGRAASSLGLLRPPRPRPLGGACRGRGENLQPGRRRGDLGQEGATSRLGGEECGGSRTGSEELWGCRSEEPHSWGGGPDLPALRRASPLSGESATAPPQPSCSTARPKALHSWPGTARGRTWPESGSPDWTRERGRQDHGLRTGQGMAGPAPDSLRPCPSARPSGGKHFLSLFIALWGREGPQAALPAFSLPAFSCGLQGRPRTSLPEVAVGRALGVCRQCPHWDKVAEGRRRCPLSASLGRPPACGRLAGRGQAACLTALGAGVSSGRGRPRAVGLPRPEVAQRKGHIPVSVMPGMRLPTPGQGGAFLGAGGWGRGLEPAKPGRP